MKNSKRFWAVAGLACIAFLAWFFLGPENASCNVAYLKLHGEVVTYVPAGDATTTSNYPADETSSEDLTQSIRDAARDDGIKAIVLEIDSPGGSPVGGEEIASALRTTGKPTAALIRDMGDSAAYMAATGADTIFASAFSDVGDIGITASYVDNSQQNQKDGLNFHQLSIGPYKDMYNPDKPLTPAEQNIIMAQLKTGYDRFVGIVAENRNMSTTTVIKLADGSSKMGEEALAEGLIDSIGNIDDLRTYLSEKLHTRAVICGVDE